MSERGGTQADAARQKALIEEYWRKRGYSVPVSVVRVGEAWNAAWGVRIDVPMPRGMPPAECRIAKGRAA